MSSRQARAILFTADPSFLQVHHVNWLTYVPGSNVRHHVGRLFATKFAVGALESRRLAALELEMPGHVAFDGEGSSALGAAEWLCEAVRQRPLCVRVLLPPLRIVIRQ